MSSVVDFSVYISRFGRAFLCNTKLDYTKGQVRNASLHSDWSDGLDSFSITAANLFQYNMVSIVTDDSLGFKAKMTFFKNNHMSSLCS